MRRTTLAKSQAQRPSQGCGTAKQILNPRYAATQFFTRLLHVPGWQSLPLTDATRAVQHSGIPGAYAQWEQAATTIVAALQGKHAPGCGPQDAAAGNPKAQIAVQAALSQLGVPYAFGGGDRSGPTRGTCTPGSESNDCHIVGFDCSWLMLYARGKAGVTVPHYTVDMWSDPAFTHVADQTQLQLGDMVMFQTKGVPEHTGMYIGSFTTLLKGLTTPNGPAFSIDGSRMYLADSRARRIDAFDYDLQSGELSNRRLFVQLGPDEGVPDGMTVDAEDHLWSAIWGGAQVRRYSPDGTRSRVIELPARQPSSCAFGGPDLDHLYVTSAATGLDPAGPADGAIMVVDQPGVRGRPATPARLTPDTRSARVCGS